MPQGVHAERNGNAVALSVAYVVNVVPRVCGSYFANFNQFESSCCARARSHACDRLCVQCAAMNDKRLARACASATRSATRASACV